MDEPLQKPMCQQRPIPLPCGRHDPDKAGLRRLSRLLDSAVPLLIIGGLLYAGLFIKPSAGGVSVPPPPIEKRDSYYGMALPSLSTIWAVGTFGKVVRSDDAGKSWNVQPTPVTANLQSIAAWDAGHAVVVGNQGIVIITRDGGKSWSSVAAPRSDVANKLMKVRIAPDGRAWAVGEMGAVLVSGDHGATWTRAAAEQDVTWGDIALDGERGVLVGEFGKIAISGDGGVTWSPVISPVQSSLTAVAFRDHLHGVAVGLEGVILETEDGGKNWTRVPIKSRQHLLDVIWDGNAWVAVGNRGIALKSADASPKNWTTMLVAEQAFGWYTKVEKSGNRYLFAGATLATAENGTISNFGKSSQR
ncbi:MAG: hypothetical protein JWR40_3644 [Massilia sp.]|jgi:photosystem II stability/assembly factor-like uncharacterized protein|nr:hypothetical protein [Massilia sp.]